jgi:serine/threonine protein kinase
MQIVRDVAQGLRFLHASKPPIFHGDLKAKNILIDSRFRAKVCDFGLSVKSRSRLSGTPYWYVCFLGLSLRIREGLTVLSFCSMEQDGT